MAEKEIGSVTHYFGHIGVAALTLTDTLRVGETVHLKGQHTDLIQAVDSMQVEHQTIDEAQAGQDIAIKVQGRVHPHDKVYLVS